MKKQSEPAEVENTIRRILLSSEQKQKGKNCFPFYEQYHDSSYIKSHDCRPEVSLKDKRENRKYILVNDSNKEVVVYLVDGGIITTTSEKKCDYAIYTEDDLLILVELKGSDYLKALEQINNTITLLIKNQSIKLSKMHARVVLSRMPTPAIITTEEKKLKDRLKIYKGNLEKKNILLKESTSML